MKKFYLLFFFLYYFRNLNATRNTLKIHNVPNLDRTRIMTDVCQQALKEFQTKKKKS
jgi:hypothetical protein